MDPGLITAITTALAALGAGAWKLIDRMDKKRERREASVEALLKAQAEASEKRALEWERKHNLQVAESERRYNRLHAHATKWREQLVAAHIDPIPADWPEENL